MTPIRTTRTDLAKALAAVSPAIWKRGNPGWASVHIKAGNGVIVATGNDTSLTLQWTIVPDAPTFTETEFAVNYARLNRLVSVLPEGDVELEHIPSDSWTTEKRWEKTPAMPRGEWVEHPARSLGELEVRSGSVRARVLCSRVEDFPMPSTPDTPHEITYGAGVGKRVIDLAKVATPDETRPILTGVYFSGRGEIVATDSYRLGMHTVTDAPEHEPMLVPARACRYADRKTWTIRRGPHHATWTAGQLRVTTRLIEGVFPTYQSLIPASHPNAITFDRKTMLAGLRFAAVAARNTGTPTRFEPVGEDRIMLEVRMQEDGVYQYDVPLLEVTGQPALVGLSPEYVRAGVALMKHDRVTLGITDALKVVSMRDDDMLYLLMPVRTP